MKFFRKRSSSKVPAPYHDEIRECKNCGYRDNGNYCSNCGQSFAELKRPVKQLLGDLVGAFNFDASFFRTVGPFLFKPGFLAREYLEGRRKKYMSPVRLYLFLSILFFFIARISTHQTTSSIDSSSLSNALDSASVVTSGDSIVLDQFLSDSLDLQYMGDTTAEDTIETAREKKIREGIQATLDDPDQFMDEILEIISYALFLLMPLFAAILMLLYIRRKRYYIEHLLFALNMHSFALLILTVMVGLQLIFRVQNGFVAWFALVIPVYFIIGMKRFYAQGIPKVLLKAVLLAMIYGLLLFVTLVLILFMAMFWV